MRIPIRSLAALGVLATLGGTALAQVTTPPPQASVIHTLQTPPMTLAETYACTIANISAEPVAIQSLALIGSPTAVAGETWRCSIPGTLQPGMTCMIETSGNGNVSTSNRVACRVKHTGSAGSILGAMISRFNGINHGAVTLQALSGAVAP